MAKKWTQRTWNNLTSHCRPRTHRTGLFFDLAQLLVCVILRITE